MPLITNSRVKTFRRCQRLHALQYVGCLRSVEEAEALRFGTHLHVGLEHWWRALLPASGFIIDWEVSDFGNGPVALDLTGWTLEDVPCHADAFAFALHALRTKRHPDPFAQVRLEELLWGYTLRWSGEGITPISVESEFRAPLRHPHTGELHPLWEQAGKLDVLAQRGDDKVLIEHKSSAEDIGVGGTYWKRLLLDGQVSMYFDGADALGHPVETCVYDVVGKPKIERLRATTEADRKYTKPMKDAPSRLYANQRDADETLDEYRQRVRALLTSPEGQARYFVRDDVARMEHLLDEHRLDLWATAEQMPALIPYGTYVPRNTDACLQYGRACEFHDVCSTGDVSLLDDPNRFKRLDSPHPELTEVTK